MELIEISWKSWKTPDTEATMAKKAHFTLSHLVWPTSNVGILLLKVPTLESLIIVPLVIKVPQPHGGVKIVLYDMLIEIRLS